MVSPWRQRQSSKERAREDRHNKNRNSMGPFMAGNDITRAQYDKECHFSDFYNLPLAHKSASIGGKSDLCSSCAVGVFVSDRSRRVSLIASDIYSRFGLMNHKSHLDWLENVVNDNINILQQPNIQLTSWSKYIRLHAYRIETRYLAFRIKLVMFR